MAARALILLAALAAPGPRPAPPRLSDTGLYRPGTREVDPRNLPYAPQYPLWSDGAGKSRWIRLPAGTRIGARDEDAWSFPVGTRLWKEFRLGGRPVETRLLWQAAPGRWTYATYRWRPDGSDADLAPEAGIRDAVPLDGGGAHSLPSVADCRACHENGGPPVLGFTALQLSDDRDPLAPHTEPLPPGAATLKALAGRRLLEGARPDLLARPPRIPGPPATRAALGYLAANCGTCHRPTNPIPHLALDLSHRAAARTEAEEPAWTTALDRPTHRPLAGVAEPRQICPGAPDRSLVPARMGDPRPALRMPPLGTVRVDEAAVDLLRRWIAEDLPPARKP